MTTQGYARGTTVPVERSKMELDKLLGKHGAASRGIMSDDHEGQVVVIFALYTNRYRIHVPLPKLADFPDGEHGKPRGWYGWSEPRRQAWQQAAHAQACAERWRSLILLVKSKLEIVRLGLSTAEREFMADMILANGKTVAEVMESGAGRRLLNA